MKAAGRIRHCGVSNFDVDDLEDLHAEDPDISCAANQVTYNFSARGIERDLYPKCHEDKVAVIAYCSLGQGGLLDNPGLATPAKKHNVTNVAIVLAFTLRLPGMISIPKSGHEKRILEHAVAADLVLDAEDLKSLDQIFPSPRAKLPLAITYGSTRLIIVRSHFVLRGGDGVFAGQPAVEVDL